MSCRTKKKAKFYENGVKIDAIEFENIDELKKKYKRKWD